MTAETGQSTVGGPPALVWRVPSWQPALLFLVTSALAALNLYSSPPAPVRVVTVAIALGCLGAAVSAARMYLVADDAGIGIRRVMAETSLAWEDITAVEVTRLRGGSMTLQLHRQRADPVTVPPALVLPTLPVSTPRAAAMLGARANQLSNRRPTSQ